jgi:hypothetical protein
MIDLGDALREVLKLDWRSNVSDVQVIERFDSLIFLG